MILSFRFDTWRGAYRRPSIRHWTDEHMKEQNKENHSVFSELRQLQGCSPKKEVGDAWNKT